MNKKEGFVTKTLKKLEKIGNKLPSPATMFFILSVAIIAISFIAEALKLSVTYEVVSQGEIIIESAQAKSLLSADGWNYITTNMIKNFKDFYALGVVLVIMLMVGVAQGSGLLKTLIYYIAKITPPAMITPMVAFIGIMLSVASSTGYVVLIPLAAILYKEIGRHPISGIAVAFAATSAGWGANLLIAPNDPALAEITQKAVNMINPDYVVQATANWYAAAASVILLTGIIVLVDKYLVSPLFKDYKNTEAKQETVKELTVDEKRGLRYASISAMIYVGAVLFVLITGAFGGFGKFVYTINDAGNYTLIKSPFLIGIIVYMGLLFLIPGIFYGIGAKTIRSEKDVIAMMEESIRGLAPFIVIIFFASLFTSYFTYTNLGQILAVSGAELLQSLNLTGIGILVVFALLMAFLNLFLAVDIAKWTIIAPIFVPLFYQLGYAPELTQMFYRIGDSSSNTIAPLMPFFPLILSIMKKYDPKAGMGTLVSTMFPYTAVIFIVWIIFMVAWVLLGIPVGPGVINIF